MQEENKCTIHEERGLNIDIGLGIDLGLSLNFSGGIASSSSLHKRFQEEEQKGQNEVVIGCSNSFNDRLSDYDFGALEQIVSPFRERSLSSSEDYNDRDSEIILPKNIQNESIGSPGKFNFFKNQQQGVSEDGFMTNNIRSNQRIDSIKQISENIKKPSSQIPTKKQKYQSTAKVTVTKVLSKTSTQTISSKSIISGIKTSVSKKSLMSSKSDLKAKQTKNICNQPIDYQFQKKIASDKSGNSSKQQAVEKNIKPIKQMNKNSFSSHQNIKEKSSTSVLASKTRLSSNIKERTIEQDDNLANSELESLNTMNPFFQISEDNPRRKESEFSLANNLFTISDFDDYQQNSSAELNASQIQMLNYQLEKGDILANSNEPKDILANLNEPKDILANFNETKDILANSNGTKDIFGNSCAAFSNISTNYQFMHTTDQKQDSYEPRSENKYILQQSLSSLNKSETSSRNEFYQENQDKYDNQKEDIEENLEEQPIKVNKEEQPIEEKQEKISFDYEKDKQNIRQNNFDHTGTFKLSLAMGEDCEIQQSEAKTRISGSQIENISPSKLRNSDNQTQLIQGNTRISESHIENISPSKLRNSENQTQLIQGPTKQLYSPHLNKINLPEQKLSSQNNLRKKNSCNSVQHLKQNPHQFSFKLMQDFKTNVRPSKDQIKSNIQSGFINKGFQDYEEFLNFSRHLKGKLKNSQSNNQEKICSSGIIQNTELDGLWDISQENDQSRPLHIQELEPSQNTQRSVKNYGKHAKNMQLRTLSYQSLRDRQISQKSQTKTNESGTPKGNNHNGTPKGNNHSGTDNQSERNMGFVNNFASCQSKDYLIHNLERQLEDKDLIIQMLKNENFALNQRINQLSKSRRESVLSSANNGQTQVPQHLNISKRLQETNKVLIERIKQQDINIQSQAVSLQQKSESFKRQDIQQKHNQLVIQRFYTKHSLKQKYTLLKKEIKLKAKRNADLKKENEQIKRIKKEFLATPENIDYGQIISALVQMPQVQSHVTTDETGQQPILKQLKYHDNKISNQRKQPQNIHQ